MASMDKVKVAVRVRPFNRRGECDKAVNSMKSTSHLSFYISLFDDDFHSPLSQIIF